MDQAFRDVLEFHEKLAPHQIGDRPSTPHADQVQLRMRLIREEFGELSQAWSDDDLPGIADAIADLIYVLVGMAITYGIDLRPVWKAVHAANMAKVGGPTREDGKILKPPGWRPPDIAGILARQDSLRKD